MNSSNDAATRKTILSGSTTTGNLTLGNYIGAVSNWKAVQQDCLRQLMRAGAEKATASASATFTNVYEKTRLLPR
ncbi:MAG: hypothetical protein ACPHRE_00465 [Pseudomonadales bacterium]